MKLGVGLVELSIHLLAFVLISDTLLYVISHVLPKEPAADLFNGLVSTEMASCIHAKNVNDILLYIIDSLSLRGRVSTLVSFNKV